MIPCGCECIGHEPNAGRPVIVDCAVAEWVTRVAARVRRECDFVAMSTYDPYKRAVHIVLDDVRTLLARIENGG